MTPLVVEAIYENGVFKPSQPVCLMEHEKVRLTVHTQSDWVERTAGMIPWTGDAESLRRFAEDPELDLEESP